MKSIKAKIMEFIALDSQPFSVVGDVGFHRLVEHRYTLPSALFFRPKLDSISVDANSFTTYIYIWNAVWVFACQKRYSSTVKAVQKSLQANTGHEQCVYSPELVIKHNLFDCNF